MLTKVYMIIHITLYKIRFIFLPGFTISCHSTDDAPIGVSVMLKRKLHQNQERELFVSGLLRGSSSAGSSAPLPFSYPVAAMIACPNKG
jgi:hypothetical protein